MADGDHAAVVLGDVLNAELRGVLREARVDRADVPHDLCAVLAGVEAGAAGGEEHVADGRQLVFVALEATQDYPGRVGHAACMKKKEKKKED